MKIKTCIIDIQQLADGNYRAVCVGMFPDCQAVAPTAEEAREAVEKAIEQLLEEQNRMVEEVVKEKKRKEQSGGPTAKLP